MVRKVITQPIEFKGRFNGYDWWELHDGERVYAVVASYARAGDLALHLTVTRPFTHAVLRHLRADARAMETYCHQHGLERVVGVADGGNESFGRFCALMGFTPPQHIQVAYKEVLHHG